MPADEVTTGSDVDAARVRTGPRHAAPKKPLFTRFHMPAGKAIALAAMPTAVLMGMGFTPTLANAEDQPASKSLTVDEYKDCVAALEDAQDPSASPTPSASQSASGSADDAADGTKDDSASGSGDGATGGGSDSSGGTSGSGGSTSPDSGSGDVTEPAPAASAEASEPQKSETSADTPTAAPSPSETDKNLLETIGDTITDLFDGKDATGTATASPTPSASETASTGTGDTATDTDTGTGSDTGSADSGSAGSGKGTTDAAGDAVKDTADKAGDTVADTGKKAEETAADAADATASPSPSESATTDVDDCPVATEDESGIDNKTPLPDDPWYLNASSLLLKGADYQGIVEVKTANGTRKKVLKYVISEGTDIGDLHQTVSDERAGVTYHVQAGPGTTSTIRNGDTIMYTESISGNLFGLIPVTFDPENPPPLNIPLIYFTKVKVVQAGQFGGDLHIPGMHLYNTE
ncbi:hypothetical protein AB0N31_05465 [Streptomyces sp. NPDC051051]|uniref:hypothetical protein n=1 Tax=Streptomyces sp. NPDC051051 TaxID=3155666 RepID=UPI0034131620